MYDDFINSLSDTQLELAYLATEEDKDTLSIAIADAYWNRGQKTVKFIVKQSLVEEFQRLLALDMLPEAQNKAVFQRQTRALLEQKRLLNGWTHDLEAAFKAIIYEVLEQL